MSRYLVLTFVWFAGLASGITWQAWGQLPTTTAAGITVVQGDILQVMAQSDTFWPGVRRQLVAEEFNVAPRETREQAAEFLKQVDRQMMARIFDGNESQAQDVIEFAAHRVRVFALLRQLRDVLGEPLMCSLKDRWDRERRSLGSQPAEDWTAAMTRLEETLRDEMTERGVPAADVVRAGELWQRLGQVQQLQMKTGTGRMMLDLEQQVARSDTEFKVLMSKVSRAADWAMVRATPDGPLTASAFLPAWRYCEKHALPSPVQDGK